MKEIDRFRLHLIKKVGELRRERRWTQAHLAKVLDLSQSRFSEIENGQGSLTAEQFLALLKIFNVTADYFVENAKDAEKEIQNTLARMGTHLRENSQSLPSERVKSFFEIVREVVSAPVDPRAITALAPIIVENAQSPILNKLRLHFFDTGFIYRFGWILENTLESIRSELHVNPREFPSEWKLKYQRAEDVLNNLLSFRHFVPTQQKNRLPDVLDVGLSSKKSVEEVRRLSSKISKKWGIVTRIQIDDFIQALKEARDHH